MEGFLAKTFGGVLLVFALTTNIVSAQAPPTSTTDTLTILYSMTAKEGKEQELANVIAQLLRQGKADDGNLAYTFLQQKSNPREYVLFEQWRDTDALRKHIARLQAVFGPPRPGGNIPAAILDLCEKTQGVNYLVVK
jgi:quinol monooxygenase YgiN